MYADDEIEQWRYGDRCRKISENAMTSNPNLSLSASSSTLSGSSFRSRRSISSSSSWRSWKPRCRRTGEYCAAGHELVQIPAIDRQRYLQRKEMLLQQQQESKQMQEQSCRYPHDPPSNVTPMTMLATTQSPIIIECDCCSRVISEEHYIAGCCLQCDIDVCEDCFRNGQSYIDVVSKESRENDLCDERDQQQHQDNSQHRERYNGRRPTYMGTGRVSYDEYPDPTAFQWSFTGSGDEHDAEIPVEYFEKDFGKEVGVIQLNFYYTIGTVQTTIVDPVRRIERDLFTKSQSKMSQQSYRKILKDPRSYNNERYKKGDSTAYDLDYIQRRERQQVL